MRISLNVLTIRSKHFKMIRVIATGLYTLEQLVVFDVALKTNSKSLVIS